MLGFRDWGLGLKVQLNLRIFEAFSGIIQEVSWTHGFKRQLKEILRPCPLLRSMRRGNAAVRSHASTSPQTRGTHNKHSNRDRQMPHLQAFRVRERRFSVYGEAPGFRPAPRERERVA